MKPGFRHSAELLTLLTIPRFIRIALALSLMVIACQRTFSRLIAR